VADDTEKRYEAYEFPDKKVAFVLALDEHERAAFEELGAKRVFSCRARSDKEATRLFVAWCHKNRDSSLRVEDVPLAKILLELT
jgi:hypothetical protein